MKVFIKSDNIFSPLGKTTEEVFSNMVDGKSSVRLVEDSEVCKVPAFLSVFEESFSGKLTKFEQICTNSIKYALADSGADPSDKKTQLILSTTKGDIGVPFDITAGKIAENIGFVNKPLVVSNACISGVVSVIIAQRLISQGFYDNIVVVGADVLTNFIVSGFQSLKAIGSSICKPFDADRDGINLGECASTLVLSRKEGAIEVINGAFNSDANHISGPSRTAEGLYLSIRRTLEGFKEPVDFISGHGTATSFNDETESIGFDRAGLNEVPVNSLKPYFGHTLGAAGVAEIAVSAMSIKEGVVLKSPGYEKHGVSKEINVLKNNLKGDFSTCLKTASGFGGCNASIIFKRNS